MTSPPLTNGREDVDQHWLFRLHTEAAWEEEATRVPCAFFFEDADDLSGDIIGPPVNGLPGTQRGLKNKLAYPLEFGRGVGSLAKRGTYGAGVCTWNSRRPIHGGGVR